MGKHEDGGDGHSIIERCATKKGGRKRDREGGGGAEGEVMMDWWAVMTLKGFVGKKTRKKIKGQLASCLYLFKF